MNYRLNKTDEAAVIAKLIAEINEFREPIKIMEVCGTHTMAIGRWGIRKLLPDNIQLISGPGCPVCVTPNSIVDALCSLKDVTIASFGDLLRVPGKNGTLEKARTNGLDVRVVYSPFDALEFAKEKPTVFAGIGFETTSPTIAYTIKYAKEHNIKNFYVLPAFKTIPIALETLLSSKDIAIDFFLLPGHVSTIIGAAVYRFVAEKYKVGGVVAGFDPVEILTAIKMLLIQKKNNAPKVEIEYKRVVTEEGNLTVQELFQDVFTVTDSWWRGIGMIPGSGYGISEKYREYDAKYQFNIPDFTDSDDNPNCRCGDVLKGKITPKECKLFGKACTPGNPVGPCMVSQEGSCAAYYRYEI